MSTGGKAKPDRARRLARRGTRRMIVLLAPAGFALPTAVLGAGDRAAGGAGEAMPSFLLPSLMAVGMCLAVLALACRRFRKE